MHFVDLFQVFKRNEDVKENNNQPPSNVEFILDDDDCPLSILMNCPPSQGKTNFSIRYFISGFQGIRHSLHFNFERWILYSFYGRFI
jgi:hypothetical protein